MEDGIYIYIYILKTTIVDLMSKRINPYLYKHANKGCFEMFWNIAKPTSNSKISSKCVNLTINSSPSNLGLSDVKNRCTVNTFFQTNTMTTTIFVQYYYKLFMHISLFFSKASCCYATQYQIGSCLFKRSSILQQ
jgi:hypothetical protein